MAVTLRLRDIPHALEDQVRDAADAALDGDWCITLSRSHVDGQLYLQLESRRSAAVLSAIDGVDVDVEDLEGLLRRLSAAAACGTRVLKF
jgi:translation initiation factor 1 (eIF-1/SUI1)